jgi:hypothetical protein
MTEHDLHAVAFPKLDEAQLAALGGCHLTTFKRYRDGEKLFEVGQRDFKFLPPRWRRALRLGQARRLGGGRRRDGGPVRARVLEVNVKRSRD